MLSYRRSVVAAIVPGRGRSRNDTRMATMRLSVDGFAQLLSRKTLLATAAVGAVALIALGAFSWKHAPVAAPTEAVVRPARIAEIKFRSHMHSLTLAGIVAPRIETTLGFRVAGKVTAREVDV